MIDRRLFAHFDWGLLIAAFLIPLTGLVVLYSAGFDPDSDGFRLSYLPFTIRSSAFLKQAAFLLIGIIPLVIGMSIPSSFLHRFAYLVYGICILLLIGVLLHGTVQNGSRRWFSFAGFNIQPAEIMKLGLVLSLSRFLSKSPPSAGGYGFKQLFAPFAFFMVPMAFIMRQPDLGTALSVGAIGMSLLLFLGIRWKVLALMLLAAVLVAIPVWSKLHGYQKQRIVVLFNPNDDPRGSGYHIIQSKIAVGSGGLFGKGYLKGTQAHLEFLPEHTTDFIFSVLAEEWGFLGSVFILCLYAIFVYRLLRVVSRSRDLFSSLVVFGISISIGFHVIINIGMVVGLVPVVGIPLPMFSYGGSSLLSNMFSLGIVLGISMRRFSLITKN